jgi:TolB protein
VIRGVGSAAEIYAMRPDGTESRQLTRNTSLDATPDWSPDGRHIVFIRVQDTTSAAVTPGPEIWVMNADGSGQRRLLEATHSPEHPRWSPDGQRIAFEAYDPSVGTFRPYVMTADGSNVHALSSSAGNAASVEWSPDGTQLLFLSNRASPYFWTMYVVQVDGSGERQVAGDSACTSDVSDPRWSPNGARIAYTCHAQSGVATLYTIRADGTGPVPVTAPGWGPAWSPDDRQLAFGSSRDGGYDVYVVDMSSGAVSRVTRDGATYGVAAWGGGR